MWGNFVPSFHFTGECVHMTQSWKTPCPLEFARDYSHQFISASPFLLWLIHVFIQQICSEHIRRHPREHYKCLPIHSDTVTCPVFTHMTDTALSRQETAQPLLLLGKMDNKNANKCLTKLLPDMIRVTEWKHFGMVSREVVWMFELTPEGCCHEGGQASGKSQKQERA